MPYRCGRAVSAHSRRTRALLSALTGRVTIGLGGVKRRFLATSHVASS